MGIRSQVRVEYWQNDSKVPLSNALLYPERSDEIARAEIDPSNRDLYVHDLETAWNLASLSASGGNENLVDAGFRLGSLIEGMKDLKSELSDRTVIRSTNLNLVYPHPLFNTVRLAFESQSTETFFGSPNGVRDAGRVPWSALSKGIQLHSDNGRFHRNTAYVINLDELHAKMAANSDRFYSAPDMLRPFVFEFAVREAGVGKGGPVSILHIVTLNIFKKAQAAPKAYTEIVYWLRRPNDAFGQIVARRRLMDFAPRIWPFTPGAGDEFQFAEAPLVVENENWLEEGKFYNLVSVTFTAVSRRKHDGLRPCIEVTADHTPFAGGTRLSTHVTSPRLSPAVDERGQPYVAEGLGMASVIFSPATASPGTIVFGATQEPGEWAARQSIRLFAGARAAAAAAGAGRTNDRQSGPICITEKWGQP